MGFVLTNILKGTYRAVWTGSDPANTLLTYNLIPMFYWRTGNIITLNGKFKLTIDPLYPNPNETFTIDLSAIIATDFTNSAQFIVIGDASDNLYVTGIEGLSDIGAKTASLSLTIAAGGTTAMICSFQIIINLAP